MAFLFFIVF